MCCKVLIILYLLIFATLTCLESRKISGIPTGRNMCHLFTKFDICKGYSLGYLKGWC